jgi:hypothetical protein
MFIPRSEPSGSPVFPLLPPLFRLLFPSHLPIAALLLSSVGFAGRSGGGVAWVLPSVYLQVVLGLDSGLSLGFALPLWRIA